eukprot:Filipodium_phascolosomae@DN3332_c0_g1_i1.p1
MVLMDTKAWKNGPLIGGMGLAMHLAAMTIIQHPLIFGGFAANWNQRMDSSNNYFNENSSSSISDRITHFPNTLLIVCVSMYNVLFFPSFFSKVYNLAYPSPYMTYRYFFKVCTMVGSFALLGMCIARKNEDPLLHN